MGRVLHVPQALGAARGGGGERRRRAGRRGLQQQQADVNVVVPARTHPHTHHSTQTSQSTRHTEPKTPPNTQPSPRPPGKAALFEFPELCEAAVAAADYIALAHKYHTLALSGVPAFGPANRSAAYRLVTLIDVLYENRRAGGAKRRP